MTNRRLFYGFLRKSAQSRSLPELGETLCAPVRTSLRSARVATFPSLLAHRTSRWRIGREACSRSSCSERAGEFRAFARLN
eukprot:scaffold407_cov251-Pinguiococcus_pyrenoidosus.AAC.43